MKTVAGDRSAPVIHLELDALHAAVLRGDGEAREAICLLLVPELKRRLTRALRRLDSELVQEAVHDTVLKYLGAPGRYRPGRHGLLNWLFVLARNAALDLDRKASRLGRRYVSNGMDFSGIALPVADDPDADQRRAEDLTWYRTHLLSACWTGEERRMVIGALAGESPEAQAQALRLTEADLKRAWQRIKRRIERAGVR